MVFEKCVHELFEAQADRTPDAPSLLDGDRRLSYRELNERANRLAHHLARLGAAREKLVGILLERSVEAVTAILAVLKTGGAYVVLDPGQPAARLQQLLDDCRPLIVLAPSGRMTWLTLSGFVGVPVDVESVVAAESAENPRVPCSPDNLAYLTYTSGSTGEPKGVMSTHRGITNGLAAPPFGAADSETVCALIAPLSFGFSAAQLFLPLLSGAPVRLIPDEQVKDVRRFAAALADGNVTSVGMVTPLLRQLIELGAGALERARRLRTVTMGGAALTRDLAEAFHRALPETILKNGYAASECGGAILVSEYAGPVPDQLSLGQPFPNVTVRVLDEELKPVPVGGTGEIYVSARHLARGYLGSPGLTAMRFVADPYGEAPGARLFRTGDLGRCLANGEIEFLGRADDQVKIRGYRISLGEIETVLHAHPQVSEAVVTTHDGPQGLRLVAYVVFNGPGRDTTTVKMHVASRLPDYMVPSLVVFMDALPLTATGKVDRLALAPPEPLRPELVRAYTEPATPLEAAIAQIWADALGLDRVGMHDDFLELGGDSLIATQIVARIWETFSTEVPFEMLFERPTISGLIDQCFPDSVGAQTSAA